MFRGSLAEVFPVLASLGISGLEGGQFGSGLIHLSGIGFCFLVSEFIEILELLNRGFGLDFGASCRAVSEEEFTELGPPVAEVIHANHAMSETCKESGEGIP